MSNLTLSPNHLSTPEVQRVVVEHIVKSAEISSQLHSPAKLSIFSLAQIIKWIMKPGKPVLTFT